MQNGLEQRQPNHTPETPLGWGQTMRNIGFVLLAVLLSWLMSGVFVLKENQYAIVSQLGHFHSVRSEGVHWVMPFPFAQYRIVPFSEKGNVTVGSIRAPAGSGLANHTVLSADGKPFIMQVQLQYRIPDVKRYLTTQAVEVEPFLRHAAAATMRQFAAQHTWQQLHALTPKQLSKQLQTKLQRQLNALSMGINITQVVGNTNAIIPTEAAQKAYADLTKQQQQFAAKKAEISSQNSESAARAHAEQLREAAQTYKEKTITQAKNRAAQFAALLPQYQNNPQATRAYLHQQTMRTVFENTKKVIVDNSVSNPVYITASSHNQKSADAKPSTQKPTADNLKKPDADADTNINNNDNNQRTRDPDALRQRTREDQR